MTGHPYHKRPDYSFWRRAVAPPPVEGVDPVISPKFKISKDDKVVTAGSCFAQHIARHLKAHDFNFFVTETAHPFASSLSSESFGYGLFSARYGNVYTSRQLLQLLQRAFGYFIPEEDYWRREDGRIQDPFRPTIQPKGFASKYEYDRDREQHFSAVRRAIEQMDVFVFTLGLTETWLSSVDGAAYPICPGVSGGSFDARRHKYVNLNVRDVISDLQQSIDFIQRHNQSTKIILTVFRTVGRNHGGSSVLVATTYSKSVLRVAADEIASCSG